jgi:hypothetical protein
MKAVRGPQVLPLLTEGVREPRESPNAHSWAEIAALNNRSTNTGRIGTAHDWDHLHCGDFRRRVSSFAFLRRAMDLEQRTTERSINIHSGV